MGAGVFQRVQTARPGRSVFNLSYEKKFTCDMGQLIPILCDEMVPGDKFKIGNQSIIRMQPLVAPAMHEINQFVHYFFVPYRLLWDDWEQFITKGVTGDYSAPVPEWNPTNTAKGSLGISSGSRSVLFLRDASLDFLVAPTISFLTSITAMRLSYRKSFRRMKQYLTDPGRRITSHPRYPGNSEELPLPFR